MKTVDEIMALVDCHRRAYCGDYREYVITKTNDDLRSAIEAALKEQEGTSVGDLNFEGWFSEYDMAHKGTKQQMRDAYAAGFSDTATTKAQPMSESDLSDLMDEVDPFCTPYPFKEIVRAAERHHGIGE